EARHMASKRARIDVIPATGAIADVKIDRFALVKVRGTLRVSERNRTEREDHRGANQYQNTHVVLPLPPSRNTRRALATDVQSAPTPVAHLHAQFGKATLADF